MGIGSHFNCCGKSDLKKTVLIIDENDTDNQEVANKENEDKKIIENKNIIQSNTNFNRDYTFQAKSSQCINSVLVLPNNESDVNKGPFVPNTIEQKNTKEALESFDEMFERLN